MSFFSNKLAIMTFLFLYLLKDKKNSQICFSVHVKSQYAKNQLNVLNLIKWQNNSNCAFFHTMPVMIGCLINIKDVKKSLTIVINAIGKNAYMDI